MPDGVQDKLKKLPHFTGAVQDRQDKKRLILTEDVGRHIAVERQILGVTSAFKTLDDPGLLLRREQSVTPVIAVVGCLATEVSPQCGMERFIVSGKNIIK